MGGPDILPGTMSPLPTDRALLWLGALLYLAGFLTGLAALTRRQAPAGLRTILEETDER